MQPGFIPMSLSSTGASPCAVLGTPALGAPQHGAALPQRGAARRAGRQPRRPLMRAPAPRPRRSSTVPVILARGLHS